MNGVCTCQVRHAVDDQHRDVLQRAMAAAEELQQDDLAAHYRYRLEPCPTAAAQAPAEGQDGGTA